MRGRCHLLSPIPHPTACVYGQDPVTTPKIARGQSPAGLGGRRQTGPALLVNDYQLRAVFTRRVITGIPADVVRTTVVVVVRGKVDA